MNRNLSLGTPVHILGTVMKYKDSMSIHVHDDAQVQVTKTGSQAIFTFACLIPVNVAQNKNKMIAMRFEFEHSFSLWAENSYLLHQTPNFLYI